MSSSLLSTQSSFTTQHNNNSNKQQQESLLCDAYLSTPTTIMIPFYDNQAYHNRNILQQQQQQQQYLQQQYQQQKMDKTEYSFSKLSLNGQQQQTSPTTNNNSSGTTTNSSAGGSGNNALNNTSLNNINLNTTTGNNNSNNNNSLLLQQLNSSSRILPGVYGHHHHHHQVSMSSSYVSGDSDSNYDDERLLDEQSHQLQKSLDLLSDSDESIPFSMNHIYFGNQSTIANNTSSSSINTSSGIYGGGNNNNNNNYSNSSSNVIGQQQQQLMKKHSSPTYGSVSGDIGSGYIQQQHVYHPHHHQQQQQQMNNHMIQQPLHQPPHGPPPPQKSFGPVGVSWLDGPSIHHQQQQHPPHPPPPPPPQSSTSSFKSYDLPSDFLQQAHHHHPSQQHYYPPPPPPQQQQHGHGFGMTTSSPEFSSPTYFGQPQQQHQQPQGLNGFMNKLPQQPHPPPMKQTSPLMNGSGLDWSSNYQKPPLQQQPPPPQQQQQQHMAFYQSSPIFGGYSHSPISSPQELLVGSSTLPPLQQQQHKSMVGAIHSQTIQPPIVSLQSPPILASSSQPVISRDATLGQLGGAGVGGGAQASSGDTKAKPFNPLVAPFQPTSNKGSSSSSSSSSSSFHQYNNNNNNNNTAVGKSSHHHHQQQQQQQQQQQSHSGQHHHPVQSSHNQHHHQPQHQHQSHSSHHHNQQQQSHPSTGQQHHHHHSNQQHHQPHSSSHHNQHHNQQQQQSHGNQYYHSSGGHHSSSSSSSSNQQQQHHHHNQQQQPQQQQQSYGQRERSSSLTKHNTPHPSSSSSNNPNQSNDQLSFDYKSYEQVDPELDHYSGKGDSLTTTSTSTNKQIELKRGEMVESPISRQQYKHFIKQFKLKEKEGLEVAMEFAKESLKTLSEKVHWRVYLELADLANRQNNLKLARKFYRIVTRTQPYISQGWLEYAKMEEDYGRLEKCQQILQLGLKYCPFNESLLIKGIRHEEKMDNLEGARALLSQLRDQSIFKTWRAVMEGGLLEARAGNIDVARKIFKYLMKHVPWYGPIYQEAYKLEERCEDYERAIAIVEKGLSEDPKYGPLWFSALRLYEKTSNGQLVHTRATVDRARQSVSREVTWKVYFEAAQIEERANHLGLARAAYVKSVELCPENLLWKVWLGGSRTELNADNINVARKLVFRALKEVPAKLKSLVLLEYSRLEEYAGNINKSRRILKMAHDEARLDWKVFLESVLLEMRANNYEDATIAAKESLKIHSGAGRLWAALIQLNQLKGYQAQLKVFKKALQFVPKSGEVWCEGARIALNNNDLEKAKRFLEFAVQFTPQFGDSFIELLRLEIMEKGFNCDTSRLEQLCINADPNYGFMWLHCTNSVLDSPRQVLRNAKKLLIETTPATREDYEQTKDARYGSCWVGSIGVLSTNRLFRNDFNKMTNEERRKCMFGSDLVKP
ncbi:hypothetical protein DFA_02550 [Cavenderia fasciculata]|uniref:Uncharacterized protein n=1 Tax=Cavenderia fasciculata TaxID=261658 RepID=F4PZP7_CACFS|nr:uncharacterized protein DFA_02550 [Cavenderia fasciculata]EGG18811.1 hypothetical protein DFA_02550 [Cavenderia fasciculata]|eukprot:XP_004357273.1 hypothetical protein DFA_02550 [Cavenderia fasciculata]